MKDEEKVKTEEKGTPLKEEDLAQVCGGFGPEQLPNTEEPIRNWPRG